MKPTTLLPTLTAALLAATSALAASPEDNIKVV
jgi:hypothetical protein